MLKNLDHKIIIKYFEQYTNDAGITIITYTVYSPYDLAETWTKIKKSLNINYKKIVIETASNLGQGLGYVFEIGLK